MHPSLIGIALFFESVATSVSLDQVAKLGPLIAAITGLFALVFAIWSSNRQLRETALNLDKQLAAQAANLTMQLEAQRKEGWANRRLGTVQDAMKAIHSAQKNAIDLHWIRMAHRSDILDRTVDTSDEARNRLSERIASTRSELQQCASMLEIVDLGDLSNQLREYQYDVEDYINLSHTAREHPRVLSQLAKTSTDLIEALRTALTQ